MLLGTIEAVKGGLEGVVELEGGIEIAVGAGFVAKEFVGTATVGPGFDEGAVALDGASKVFDCEVGVAISEKFDVASVVPGFFVVVVDVEDLFVEFFSFVGFVEVLIEHGKAIEGVGVLGLEAEGGVEVFDCEGVVVVGIDHAEFLEGGFVVRVEVADFAQEDDGVGGVAGFFVDEALHKECGAVLWIFGSDFAKVVHGTVVVAAVVGYFSKF